MNYFIPHRSIRSSSPASHMIDWVVGPGWVLLLLTIFVGWKVSFLAREDCIGAAEEVLLSAYEFCRHDTYLFALPHRVT